MATPRQIQLNRSLTQAQGADGVLQIVNKSLEEFNLVNCTTALHRYAKAIAFSGGKGKGGKGGKTGNRAALQPLLARTAAVVREAGGKAPAQNLANALWAVERLRFEASPEVAALAAAARAAVSEAKRLAGFSGQNLANAAWAVAKFLAGKDAAVFSKAAKCSSGSFFLPFMDAIAERAWDLNGQELSMAAWALASAAAGEPRAKEAVETLGQAALELPYGGIASLNAQQLATLAWAFARLGCRSEKALKDIAQAALPSISNGDFNAQDLSNLGWAFGRLEVPAPKLLKALSRAVLAELREVSGRSKRASSRGFSPQQLAVLAWALARMGAKDDEALHAIAAEAMGRISELAPRDLTDVVWALAHAGVRNTAFLSAAGEIARRRQSEFGTQELLRFLGAFRRAGGDAEVQAAMASAQQELRYEFPALCGVQVMLHGETPGQRHSEKRRRVRAAALREQEELGGDPQRADGGTTGVALWEASYVLAEWLSRQGAAGKGLAACETFCEITHGAKKSARSKWRRWDDKVGVELGAGLGLPSVVASHLGARTVATDGDASVMKLLRQNVKENAGRGELRAEALLWGAEDPLTKLGLDRPPDFLLAADVIYASAKESLTKQLLSTMLALSSRDSVVIISNVRRFPEGHPKGEGRFFAALDRVFHRATVPQSSLHPDFQRSGVGSCAVHILRRKKATFTGDLSQAPPVEVSAKEVRKKRRVLGGGKKKSREIKDETFKLQGQTKMKKRKRKAPAQDLGPSTATAGDIPAAGVSEDQKPTQRRKKLAAVKRKKRLSPKEAVMR
eukprot:TRINITY_DN42061_c0_g1_i1.p1 TRINITY_DN42061_c0_g1~~TRINITY_DN42061_c0_g1_i1.p1  ORF type:complete len:806 (-),score=185.28 TRINITY_DN42061_c0_g1_i1:14-2401(-)